MPLKESESDWKKNRSNWQRLQKKYHPELINNCYFRDYRNLKKL